MRHVTVCDMDDLALGAAVLGTGGGGDPHIGKLTAAATMRRHGEVALIALDDLADDDLVIPAAMMGAPTVMVEKLPRGDEIVRAVDGLQAYLGRPIRAITPIEAGGLDDAVHRRVPSWPPRGRRRRYGARVPRVADGDNDAARDRGNADGHRR